MQGIKNQLRLGKRKKPTRKQEFIINFRSRLNVFIIIRYRRALKSLQLID
jgi:hypothetical protein